MRLVAALSVLLLAGCAPFAPKQTPTESAAPVLKRGADSSESAVDTSTGSTLCADLNGDGLVNFGDLAVLKEQFMGECTSGVFKDRMLICEDVAWNVNTAPVPPLLVLPDVHPVTDDWIAEGTWPPGLVVAPKPARCALLLDGVFLPVFINVDPDSW